MITVEQIENDYQNSDIDLFKVHALQLLKERDLALEGKKAAELRAEAVKTELDKFLIRFDQLGKRQHELLVEGQNLESTSKNWSDFPEYFSLDLTPLREAARIMKEKGGV